MKPQPNEVWQEADGCCIVYVGNDKWMAFGVGEAFGLDRPTVVLPLQRLLTADGEIAPERMVD